MNFDRTRGRNHTENWIFYQVGKQVLGQIKNQEVCQVREQLENQVREQVWFQVANMVNRATRLESLTFKKNRVELQS